MVWRSMTKNIKRIFNLTIMKWKFWWKTGANVFREFKLLPDRHRNRCHFFIGSVLPVLNFHRIGYRFSKNSKNFHRFGYRFSQKKFHRFSSVFIGFHRFFVLYKTFHLEVCCFMKRKSKKEKSIWKWYETNDLERLYTIKNEFFSHWNVFEST